MQIHRCRYLYTKRIFYVLHLLLNNAIPKKWGLQEHTNWFPSVLHLLILLFCHNRAGQSTVNDQKHSSTFFMIMCMDHYLPACFVPCRAPKICLEKNVTRQVESVLKNSVANRKGLCEPQLRRSSQEKTLVVSVESTLSRNCFKQKLHVFQSAL